MGFCVKNVWKMSRNQKISRASTGFNRELLI